MARITVSIDIDAPRERVWREAADLASHAEWMADAESIEFETEQRTGVGTRMQVATRVGPLRTEDVMEVVSWSEGFSIGVRHQGLVTGEGSFTLTDLLEGTRFTWSEDLRFPWYVGGRLTALAASPVLHWIWRRNLQGLRERVEASTDQH